MSGQADLPGLSAALRYAPYSHPPWDLAEVPVRNARKEHQAQKQDGFSLVTQA